MTLKQNIAVHFKEIEVNNGVRTFIEERCQGMLEEFPEVIAFDVSLAPEGIGFSARIRATGRNLDLVATQEAEKEVGRAADQVLDTMHQQLRKQHEKRSEHRR